MKISRLENYKKGWVIGDFEPSLIRTKEVEVCVRKYEAGDREARHVHKIADEITIIVSGKFVMNGKELAEDDVVFLEKGEPVDFECLDAGYNTVIKVPSIIGDKYFC